MATVVCKRTECKYCKGGMFCGKRTVILNAGGMCYSYFDHRGNPRDSFLDDVGTERKEQQSNEGTSNRGVQTKEDLDCGGTIQSERDNNKGNVSGGVGGVSEKTSNGDESSKDNEEGGDPGQEEKA